jgi:hypothetical protein
MKAAITALQEVYGLFVEDGSYAAAIVIWLAIVCFVFPHLPGGGAWRGPLFFAGMAVILVESVVRAARAKSRC